MMELGLAILASLVVFSFNSFWGDAIGYERVTLAKLLQYTVLASKSCSKRDGHLNTKLETPLFRPRRRRHEGGGPMRRNVDPHSVKLHTSKSVDPAPFSFQESGAREYGPNEASGVYVYEWEERIERELLWLLALLTACSQCQRSKSV
ncbi:hypothetical protein QBC35DRAFT_211821 [Podospora australis]|uniref:Uncharacterized protein n=1 Tax=Podospora australis TaxID=1536484 RepID=A0AAN6WV74_9PEZI|nr:hypothetical protein QBC35DRAFT_211821 [Podospora australis]